MRILLAAAMTVAVVAAPMASAQTETTTTQTTTTTTTTDYGWNGDTDSDWDPYRHYSTTGEPQRVIAYDERVYHGSDGRYYCRRSNGTTGLVVGAIGGGLIGHALGGGLLGTLLGVGAGGAVGKHVDQHEDDKNGRYHCE